ncbi:MAG: hypothetical protein V7L01_12295 [Nostoc sp.]|uniref:hypothetical protein n=1 Tax=Nostoc sp. TaxID=1180 RepID=UPI002FF88F8F
MFRNLILLAIAASICTAPTVVFAQDSLPKPNRKGDYYYGLWREWLVVDRDRRGLNCRSGAGANYSVIKTFDNNKKIYAYTLDDNPIERDRQGKPWIEILPTGYQYEKPCFVRANNSFIRPIPQE